MSRIIAGRARSVALAAPKGTGTRPTTDRVKEALFSSLATWFGTAERSADEHLVDLAVLDLYSGTGGLALEAASRGATRVVAVDHRTASLIRENARRARLAVDVRSAKVRSVLESLGGDFDLVFIDPPYDVPSGEVDSLLERLVSGGLLAPRALVVVERATRSPDPQWPNGFAERWQRRYGESTLHFGAIDEELP